MEVHDPSVLVESGLLNVVRQIVLVLAWEDDGTKGTSQAMTRVREEAGGC